MPHNSIFGGATEKEMSIVHVEAGSGGEIGRPRGVTAARGLRNRRPRRCLFSYRRPRSHVVLHQAKGPGWETSDVTECRRRVQHEVYVFHKSAHRTSAEDLDMSASDLGDIHVEVYFSPSLQDERRSGFEVWVCPGRRRWANLPLLQVCQISRYHMISKYGAPAPPIRRPNCSLQNSSFDPDNEVV